MPPERSRSLNAQGRQKSCAECQKGKRKCDLGHPSCSRCRKQKLTCNYPPPPSGQRHAASEGHALDAEVDFHVSNTFSDLEGIRDATLPLDFDFEPLRDPSNAAPVEFDLTAGITSLESLNQMLYSSPNVDDQMAIERAITQVRKTFSAAHVAPFAKSRVSWSIEQLKLAPKMMIEQSGTPWQHPKLYEDCMPRSVQDAYASCALFVARNGTNDEMVSRFIRERADDLVSSQLPQQPSELLARAHALMLYQIMLVFGGDVTLYSQAEKLLSIMEEAGTALLPLAVHNDDYPSSLPLYPSSSARAAWNSYIFRESVRRTVLSTFQFVSMCHLLRGQLTSCHDHLAYGNIVTLSAHLWNAKSAFDFAIAWNTKNHFVVKELDFTELLRDAQPDDVDTFSKMMLTGLQGEDDIRGWFHTKGGAL